MRLSEFWLAVSDEFGPEYGRVLTSDLVLVELNDQSAQRALAAGVPPREVWLALCRAADVPKARWYGTGLPKPARSR